MSELVKEDWTKLGIAVTLKPMGGAIWNEQYRANLHDIAMHSTNVGGRTPIIAGIREPTTVLTANWAVNPKGARGWSPMVPGVKSRRRRSSSCSSWASSPVQSRTPGGV